MSNEPQFTIGYRFRQYRKNRGISQDELARGICSRQTISLLERDNHLPDIVILQPLADRLQFPLHELMGDHVQGLKLKVQLGIVKGYVGQGSYVQAIALIRNLEQDENLLEFQRRELVLLKAECLMQTGSVSEALDLLTEMRQALERNREPDDQLMAALYNQIGTAHCLKGDIMNAYAYFERAYQTSLRFPQTPLSARIAFNMGNLCSLLPFSPSALPFYEIAYEFFQKPTDLKSLADQLFQAGLRFKDEQNHQHADDCLQQALTLYQALDVIHLAPLVRQEYESHVGIRCLPDDSIQSLLAPAARHLQLGDLKHLCFTYAGIAQALLRSNKFTEAEYYLNLALDFVENRQAGNRPGQTLQK